MRTAAYVRVSTAGQNEASQRREIERWLNGHRFKNVQWFLDKKSGDDLRRPAFEKLQAAVFNGEVDTIVVYKLDRISRSLKDGVTTLADWCKAGIRVVSVTQQLDFNGATGQLVAAVLFAVAPMEQETRRERQAAGIAVVLADDQLRCRKYQGGSRKLQGGAVRSGQAAAEGADRQRDWQATGDQPGNSSTVFWR